MAIKKTWRAVLPPKRSSNVCTGVQDGAVLCPERFNYLAISQIDKNIGTNISSSYIYLTRRPGSDRTPKPSPL